MRALERDSNMSGDSREPARREQRGLVVRQLPRGGGGRVHQAPPSPVLFGARLRTATDGWTRQTPVDARSGCTAVSMRARTGGCS